jgi:hypothetical protein
MVCFWYVIVNTVHKCEGNTKTTAAAAAATTTTTTTTTTYC